jgi:holo-[acyl-carrier-protein] synthase
MIYGIGTDSVDITRLAQSVERQGDRFVQRILGPDEHVLYQQRGALQTARGLQFLASRFAAKEAIAKALGLGMRAPMHWHAVQVLPNPLGQPLVHADSGLQAFLAQHHLRLHVSLTDLPQLAHAYAVAEQLS